MEMTGLDPATSFIIEICTVVTNIDLEIVATGPNLVCRQDASLFAGMDDWNKKQHTATGLWSKVIASEISVAQAEAETLDFIKRYVEPHKAPLCGNSIWQDRRFLRRYMPKVDAYLNYRIIDVSTVKELVKRWYPDSVFTDKQSAHRAHDDIMESIRELKHYRTLVFK